MRFPSIFQKRAEFDGACRSSFDDVRPYTNSKGCGTTVYDVPSIFRTLRLLKFCYAFQKFEKFAKPVRRTLIRICYQQKSCYTRIRTFSTSLLASIIPAATLQPANPAPSRSPIELVRTIPCARFHELARRRICHSLSDIAHAPHYYPAASARSSFRRCCRRGIRLPARPDNNRGYNKMSGKTHHTRPRSRVR